MTVSTRSGHSPPCLALFAAFLKRMSALLKIVVADGNLDAANTLAELLRMVGHNVDVDYRGDDAADLVDKVRPDVVFLE